MDFITNDNGVKLAYTLNIIDSLSAYLVIIIHGTCGNRNNLFFPSLAESLKYNSLRFDLQGNGDSEGKFSIGGFTQEINDVRCVVN